MKRGPLAIFSNPFGVQVAGLQSISALGDAAVRRIARKIVTSDVFSRLFRTIDGDKYQALIKMLLDTWDAPAALVLAASECFPAHFVDQLLVREERVYGQEDALQNQKEGAPRHMCCKQQGPRSLKASHRRSERCQGPECQRQYPSNGLQDEPAAHRRHSDQRPIPHQPVTPAGPFNPTCSFQRSLTISISLRLNSS